MPDPFTMSYIVISSALHIGHIGYTIYQNNTCVENCEKDVVDMIKNPSHIKKDLEDIEKKENDFQNTVKSIREFKLPQTSSHTHTQSLTHTHTPSLTHTHTPDEKEFEEPLSLLHKNMYIDTEEDEGYADDERILTCRNVRLQ